MEPTPAIKSVMQNHTDTPDSQRMSNVMTNAKNAAPPRMATMYCHEFSTSDIDWLNQSVTETFATPLAISSTVSPN